MRTVSPVSASTYDHGLPARNAVWIYSSGLLTPLNMMTAVHSGTVTPVVRRPTEIVMVFFPDLIAFLTRARAERSILSMLPSEAEAFSEPATMTIL